MSSIDLESQDSADPESSEYDEDEDYDDDYYNNVDEDEGMASDKEDDPETFEFQIIDHNEAQEIFDDLVAKICQEIKVSESVSRILLMQHDWNTEKILERHRVDPVGLLVEGRIIPEKAVTTQTTSRSLYCPVCFQRCTKSNTSSASCGHAFCNDCWLLYCVTQLKIGLSSGIECMNCNLLVGEEMALKILKNGAPREKYRQFLFNDEVKCHPLIRWCPGNDCGFLVKALEPKAKRVWCSKCNSIFCFKCGEKYHAPTDCYTIKKWLTKCEDDSETANYITANTKDCPNCGSCIEKNGGCNHMQCIKCKHDFCWMCCGDWRSHGSEYYECSRYKSNPNIVNESAGIQAREALKKYLFYFERWQNHADSLKREEETKRKINQKIQEKVNNNIGTWIDWQYLLDATQLLAKCRYTMMYTYPYAYFMEDERKRLFEYQQAQLELEIENLSWKLERDELYCRGEFENQMDIAEKRRLTLLKDFLVV
ncbi:E3 ubiquitin-protein ligase ARIH2-like [Stylophora pistillata]|uniref:E3 ubiquitin-protein ligase ARIH2-like n=1 Tax=Stylophora pistillata TaxID=50429 RepID=UPI000C041DCD|nr:E3 ubiquitin-protein ligase ARIH2-like [Stylophora pistillata]